MTVMRTLAVALSGLQGQLVQVEAAVTSQLPGMSVIGLPDAALAEAKQRVRVACQSSGLQLSSRFITLNLSPAELPKNGAGFDLALAISALAASGELPSDRLSNTVHIGELGLDGSVRRSLGVLPAVLAAHRAGIRTVMVASVCSQEARLVEGVEIVAVRTLLEAVNWHRGERIGNPHPSDTGTADAGKHEGSRNAIGSSQSAEKLDMVDVVGHEDAVLGLTVAAIGGHHISMTGPPVTGKTMLASRLPTLLPDLEHDEAVQVSSIASLSEAHPLTQLLRRPPFQAPHHTLTLGAMVGFGQRVVKPGVMTRASGGVLFLDEAPEFSPHVLEALRQPLESGKISIQRAGLSTELPAKFQLVLASNPCPCGNNDVMGMNCSCEPAARRRYANRVSGPLRDRIDVQLSVWQLNPTVLLSLSKGEQHRRTSFELRKLVSEARRRTASRLEATPWRLNGEVSGAWLRHPDHRLSSSASEPLDQAFERAAISMRGYDRALRVAWSFADLDGEAAPTRAHVIRALSLRTGVHA